MNAEWTISISNYFKVCWFSDWSEAIIEMFPLNWKGTEQWWNLTQLVLSKFSRLQLFHRGEILCSHVDKRYLLLIIHDVINWYYHVIMCMLYCSCIVLCNLENWFVLYLTIEILVPNKEIGICKDKINSLNVILFALSKLQLHCY